MRVCRPFKSMTIDHIFFFLPFTIDHYDSVGMLYLAIWVNAAYIGYQKYVWVTNQKPAARNRRYKTSIVRTHVHKS